MPRPDVHTLGPFHVNPLGVVGGCVGAGIALVCLVMLLGSSDSGSVRCDRQQAGAGGRCVVSMNGSEVGSFRTEDFEAARVEKLNENPGSGEYLFAVYTLTIHEAGRDLTLRLSPESASRAATGVSRFVEDKSALEFRVDIRERTPLESLLGLLLGTLVAGVFFWSPARALRRYELEVDHEAARLRVRLRWFFYRRVIHDIPTGTIAAAEMAGPATVMLRMNDGRYVPIATGDAEFSDHEAAVEFLNKRLPADG